MAKDRKAYLKAYYERNRERIRKQHRDKYYENHAYWRAKARTYRRTAVLKMYGLTPEQYEQRLRDQDGKCAICRKPERIHHGSKRVRLAVDHCKDTGAVRGLLCGACNRAIGALDHDTDTLRRAITYLEGK